MKLKFVEKRLREINGAILNLQEQIILDTNLISDMDHINIIKRVNDALDKASDQTTEALKHVATRGRIQ